MSKILEVICLTALIIAPFVGWLSERYKFKRR